MNISLRRYEFFFLQYEIHSKKKKKREALDSRAKFCLLWHNKNKLSFTALKKKKLKQSRLLRCEVIDANKAECYKWTNLEDCDNDHVMCLE